MLLDVTGDEMAGHRAGLTVEDKLVSAEIVKNNTDFGMRLQDLLPPGVGIQGFVYGSSVTTIAQRASKLNLMLSSLSGDGFEGLVLCGRRIRGVGRKNLSTCPLS